MNHKESKQNHYLRGSLGSKGKARKNIPRIISWNTTFKCDLRCAHCYMDAQERESRKELSTEEGMMLIDQIAEVSKPVLVLSGGEPLLRRDIFELARYGTEKGLRMAMGTNGVGINDQVAMKLKLSGIKKVAISVDSSGPDIHDEFRGVSGAWKNAIEGIKACLRNGVGVQFNTTVTLQNFDDIDNILQLAESLGVKDLHLFFLVPTGRGTEIEDITPVMYEQMIRKVLKKCEESALEVKPTCAPQYMRIADQMGIDMSRWSRGCIAGLSYCRIYPEGEVTPCPYLPIKLGNIRETTFKEIWENNEVLKKMRDFDNLKGRCGACEYKNKCGGCRARAYGLSSDFIEACGGLHEPHKLEGDYLGEEPWCPYQPRNFME
jgi:radical SAM protein with 4Fe4S-binding SPASM domain